MPTILTDTISTEDILAAEKVVDMDDVIADLDPEQSQFSTMLMQLSKDTAYNTRVDWLEKELMPIVSALAASATSAATTFDVTAGHGDYFRAQDIVRNTLTGEAFRVVSVSTDTLTVSRALGGVAAASSASGAQLVIVSNAAAESATLGTKKTTKSVNQYNYTQILRTPFGFSESQNSTKTYGGKAMLRERRQKLIEHKRAIEHTLFFGPRSSASERRTAGGAVEYISSNIKNAGGALTKALLDEYVMDFCLHGEVDKKVIFASPLVARAISGFYRDVFTPAKNGENVVWGAKVTGFISGAYGGPIPVVTKRTFGQFSSASTGYGGWAFVVDMAYADFVALDGRDTKLLRDREANDADEAVEEYLTEFSLRFKSESVHGLIKGVTG